MIIFCAVYSITASSPSAFSSAPLQSLLLHIMLHITRYIFIHPDPKSKFYVICINLLLFNVLYQNSDSGNEQYASFSKHCFCSVTNLPFMLTQPHVLLAGTVANIDFLLQTVPKNTTYSLSSFLTSTASFFFWGSVPGFPSLVGVLSSKVLLPGSLWSCPSVFSPTQDPHKLLFISQFLLIFSCGFNTYLFTHAPSLFF